jgi:hypothetical protein
MANQTISQLPAAGPITGTELVPIVQNGGTYHTTTGAIANSPTQTQTFLTVQNEPTLNNSRFFSTDGNFTLTDGGAQSFLRINLIGAPADLAIAGNGIVAKTSLTTVAARTMTAGSNGISISNADGVSGNPTFSLTGQVLSLANASGAGLVALPNNGTVTPRSIQGTASEIDVANGNGAAGDPTIGLADNPVVPGSEGIVLPSGNTGDRSGSPVNGTLRYNTQTGVFEGYANNAWGSIAAGTGVTSVGLAMPADFTVSGSPVTSTGTLTAAWASQAANLVFASPSGTSGTPGFRALVNNDLPNSGVVATTYGSASAVPVFVVNAKGVITSVTDTPIAIANTQVSGLGTMSTQNAGSVAITGGNINGTTIGNTTPAAGTFSSIAATSGTVSTTPANATDIANKQYVDGLVTSGITYHAAVKYEVPVTTGNLTATYNNGTAGVGATLTNAGTLAAFAPDGPTAAPGDRILIYNQTNAFENGVYTVTTVGDGSTPWVLTRATDADSYGLKDPNALGQGDAFFVTSGNTGAGETYECSTVGTITFGVTAINFVQISSAQVYNAGTGLNLSPSTTFNISNTGVAAGNYGSASSVPAISVNAQGQITSATNTSIAIAASQVTSGTLAVAQGGTNIASYVAGDLIYASATTTLSKLPIGTAGQVLTSSGSAPQYVDQSTLSVGSATNASNVAVSLDSTNSTYYLGVYSTTTGNLPTKVVTGLTVNPSTGKITGGISGGTF